MSPSSILPESEQVLLLRTSRRLEREGRLDEALGLLRDALRRGSLDAVRVEAAGRFLAGAFGRHPVKERPWTVLLAGQWTTSWVASALTAEAWARGSRIAVEGGGYDTVLQDLSALASAPDVVALLPWHQRLLSGRSGSREERAEEELAFWRSAWALLPAGSRLVQLGHDWLSPGAMGYQLGGRMEGDVRAVRRANDLLRAHLPVGAYFVDLEQVSGDLGRERCYDERQYFWTKNPFTPEGTRQVACHLWAGIRAVMTGPRKVLALDLDNTLWGGVVGEVGPHGIELGESPRGEAYRSFQRLVRGLGERGVVLAVCSKNNPADAREAFEQNRDMVLALDDFAAFDASWDPKPAALERIAARLGLGLDSFVFFDDNPAEREHVLQSLPDVEVVDVPPDPADYGKALLAGLWFEAAALTGEDLERTEHYRAEGKRRELQGASRSLGDYLASLAMVADLRPIDEAVLPRAVQLIGKTNQFNLTTRRHSRERLLEILGRPGSLGLAVSLRDRFGDHGIVGVVIGERAAGAEPPTLRLDTWLLSCRVIGRGLEDMILNRIVQIARGRGIERLTGEYIPTAKNALVAGLYSRLGFEPLGGPGEARAYTLDLARFEPLKTFVACGTEPPPAP